MGPELSSLGVRPGRDVEGTGDRCRRRRAAGALAALPEIRLARRVGRFRPRSVKLGCRASCERTGAATANPASVATWKPWPTNRGRATPRPSTICCQYGRPRALARESLGPRQRRCFAEVLLDRRWCACTQWSCDASAAPRHVRSERRRGENRNLVRFEPGGKRSEIRKARILGVRPVKHRGIEQPDATKRSCPSLYVFIRLAGRIVTLRTCVPGM